MKDKKPEIKNYINATRIKNKNRRIYVQDLPDECVLIVFKKLCTKEESKIPTALQTVTRDVIKNTTIKLTYDAAFALFIALSERFKIRLLTTDELKEFAEKEREGDTFLKAKLDSNPKSFK